MDNLTLVSQFLQRSYVDTRFMVDNPGRFTSRRNYTSPIPSHRSRSEFAFAEHEWSGTVAVRRALTRTLALTRWLQIGCHSHRRIVSGIVRVSVNVGGESGDLSSAPWCQWPAGKCIVLGGIQHSLMIVCGTPCLTDSAQRNDMLGRREAGPGGLLTRPCDIKGHQGVCERLQS